MFKMYIDEFVSICASIERNAPKHLKTETRLYIEPARFRKMLGKDLFQEVKDKLPVWRNLGWLLCDGDKPRFTKNIYIEGKTQRMIVLNRTAYEQIDELLQAEDGS